MEWYPEGLAPHISYKLSGRAKEELLAIIGVLHPRAQSFFSDIEKAIAIYQSHAVRRQDATPAKVRGELCALQEKAQGLLDAYLALGGMSSFMVNKHTETDIEHGLTDLVMICGRALADAQNLPQSGKLPNTHRDELAYNVAKALHEIVGVMPSKTRDGSQRPLKGPVFARTLEIVFSEADPADEVDYRAPMERAVDRLKDSLKSPR